MGAAPPLPLALTMGDPAGIGPEITLKAYAHCLCETTGPFVVFGNAECLRSIRSTCAIQTIATPAEALDVFEQALPVIEIPLATSAKPGLPDPRNGAAIIASITRAIDAVHSGTVSGVVTNPIAKSVLYQAGFQHPGHTEFLGELARQRWAKDAVREPVMLLASDALRVVPLTIHIPITDVPRAINQGMIIETATTLLASLERDFGITKPRIAVAGLNPHAGEDGAIGREDLEIIAPAINHLASGGMHITGPHSADTLFHAAARATYDAVMCMYHDQALIPIKTLAFDTGVNVTLGLPFVRTSPDHGTAIDIAGKGMASPTSLIEAIKLARVMAQRRAITSAHP
jgi:4-hydroxythreonine-4-phosphate dehydrogenase